MLPVLQIYRGVAAMLVLLFHDMDVTRKYFGPSPITDLFSGGWSGVQLFFVLSGFIMLYVHHDDVGRPEQFPRYLRKRLTRIYPLYILVTLVLTPFWLLVPSFGLQYHKDWSALLMSLALIPQRHFPHLQVAWTLCHEMLFYLFFGVLILSRKAGSILLLTWFALVALAQALQIQLSYPFDFLLSPNNLLFGLGMLAHLVGKRFPLRDSRFLLVSLGAAYIGSTPFVSNGTGAVLGFGIMAFGLMLLAQGKLNEIANRAPFLRLLGDASYSTYLVHGPALSVACKILHSAIPTIAPYIAFAVLVPVGITAGIACHVFVEKPLMRLSGQVGIAFNRPGSRR